jgi:hypothetical protein
MDKVNLDQKYITREISKTSSRWTWIHGSTSHRGSTDRPAPPPNTSLTLYLTISIHKTRSYGELIFSWWLALWGRSIQGTTRLILTGDMNYELGCLREGGLPLYLYPSGRNVIRWIKPTWRRARIDPWCRRGNTLEDRRRMWTGLDT